MERMKRRMSKWLVSLLAMMLVLASVTGCSSQDAEKALDVAIEVLEVVESLEAEENESADEDDALWIEDSEISDQASDSEEQTDIAGDDSVMDASEGDEESDQAIPADDNGLTVEKDGHYTSKEEVALYLHIYGELPSNFITKREAEDLGWKKKDGQAGQLHVVAPGMSIGGSKFGNYEGLLPEKKGRQYYECDINYVKGNRGAERIVYSNDGLIFYTGDHYESFEQLYPEE